MQNVIISGDVGERILTETVIKACARNGGAFVIDGKRVYETESEPKFCVVTDVERISCSCIVILGDDVKNTAFDEDDITVIVNSENMKALEILKYQGCKNVITCSLNVRASMNISGIYPQKIVSLQRTVEFNGKDIEPCEFEIVSDETDIYSLLAASAVMLLSGEDIREKYFI